MRAVLVIVLRSESYSCARIEDPVVQQHDKYIMLDTYLLDLGCYPLHFPPSMFLSYQGCY